MPQGAILSTTDVVGLYPNIPQSEGLTSLRRFLELRDSIQISSDTLIELAKIVLKNNIFEFDEKTFKQVRGTAIGTKFAPLYAILFMADIVEKIISDFEEKPMIRWRYIDDIFLLGNMEKNFWKKFLNKLNSFHLLSTQKKQLFFRCKYKIGRGGTHDSFVG